MTVSFTPSAFRGSGLKGGRGIVEFAIAIHQDAPVAHRALVGSAHHLDSQIRECHDLSQSCPGLAILSRAVASSAGRDRKGGTR